MFPIYFEQGFRHITDLSAYDHILFLVAILLGYSYKDWKTILALVTAFTIGHSITLAISTLQIVRFPTKWIEFLIPVTIFLTALIPLLSKKQNSNFKGIYFLTLLFGLIHGAGFSNYLQGILGKQSTILMPLMAFNLGVEVGQLVIVVILLLIQYLIVDLFNIPNKTYSYFMASICILASIHLMSVTWPF